MPGGLITPAEVTEAQIEEAPPNLREILKKQGYVVVERADLRGKLTLHITDAVKSIRTQCLCGLRYHQATYIPLGSWGKPDREWCRNCMFLTKNSVKNALKKQVAAYRASQARQSEAASTDST